MKVTFSNVSKTSFSGKSDLKTECSNVTAMDFLLFAWPPFKSVFPESVSPSLVNTEYTLYDMAAIKVAAKAPAMYFGFFPRGIGGGLETTKTRN